MVDFETNDPIEYTDNYFDLKFELERILNRSIDLLENKAIKNPFLRENIDKSKVLIYGQWSKDLVKEYRISDNWNQLIHTRNKEL